jgi:hypothetical protein
MGLGGRKGDTDRLPSQTDNPRARQACSSQQIQQRCYRQFQNILQDARSFSIRMDSRFRLGRPPPNGFAPIGSELPYAPTGFYSYG